jgi:hypothetical protein
MANYVLVENNQIVEYHDLLPRTWRHVSGLHLLKDNEEMLNQNGWYTIRKVEIAYNNQTHYLDGYEYNIEDNQVFEIPVLKEIIYSNVPDEQEEIRFNIELANVRNTRDQLLRESDWTQMADVQQMRSQEWKNIWANYRQELRDVPNKCISGEINIYMVNWPNTPESVYNPIDPTIPNSDPVENNDSIENNDQLNSDPIEPSPE